jgi:hypothetical protein
MKTILHGNVDGHEMCLGFADATRDPEATENRVKTLLVGLDEQKAVDEINARIRARWDRISTDFLAIFSRKLDELRTKQEAEWFGNAKKAAEYDVGAIQVELQQASAILEVRREQLREENAVYFQPGGHESIISADSADRLIPIWTALGDHKQMTITGEILDDYRGCTVWDKTKLTARNITKISDAPGKNEILDADLTDEQRQAICSNAETKRVADMTTQARADELAIVLDSLANRAATMKDQEIIKGMATDKALRESQAWYQDQKAAAERKYA